MTSMRQYRGDFEVHLTIHATTERVLEQFQSWCQNQNFKCVRIVLSRGDHAEQPMATWRRGNTNLPIVLEEAHRYADELNRANFSVVRVKIEAAPFNDEIPVGDEDADAHDPKNYFEHHVKLVRDSSASRKELLAVCEQHGAHLSRNAFHESEDGREERFVTLRTYEAGRTTSAQQLDLLMAALGELGEEVVERESEYCVYDSNLDLDAGWLPHSAQRVSHLE